MKLTSRQKNIAIFVGIGAITIGYLIWKRNKNEKEATAILEYINTLPSQVDLNQATEQGIKDVQDIKLRTDRIVVKEGGKIVVGSIKDPKIGGYIANYVQRLNTAIKGAGTDYKELFEVLSRIRTKNTLKWVDTIYKTMFKEGLFEAMKSETLLNNVNYAVFSDKTKYDIAIPFLSEGKWHPALATYFNSLPSY